MRGIMIALDIYSLMISVLVLYGNLFKVRNYRQRNRSYSICAALVMAGQAFDLAARILDGREDMTRVLYIVIFFCYMLGYVMAVYFLYYLWTLIGEEHPLSKWTVVPVISLCGPYMALMLVFMLMGKIYRVENGHYVVGEWYFVSQIYIWLCISWAVVLILYFLPEMGRRKAVACFSYLIAPLISLIMHFFYPQISLSYVALGYAVLVIYVMVQAEQERESKIRENSLIEASTRDSLTGLYNRRAYDLACGQMKKFDTVGVIFCDANGLKHTNDAKGHEAGDQLLLSISNGLIDIFSRKQVFRISGDEFVVICPNMPYEIFHAQVMSLNAFVRRAGMPMASIGEAFGSGVDIYQLVKEAEQQMYIDKERFYMDYPKMERRNR